MKVWKQPYEMGDAFKEQESGKHIKIWLLSEE